MSTNTPMEHDSRSASLEAHTIALPAPTAWPMLLALGICLMLAALVMNLAVFALGFCIMLAAAVGWFREVLPHEQHEEVEVSTTTVEIVPSREKVRRIDLTETHRAQLPLRIFPIASGIKGGIAGGIAMVIPAEIYSLLRYHSLWYVVNLLGGAGVGTWINPTMEQLREFRLSAFITANLIQGATTLLVGVLYGALLPVWPKRPILLGGIVAPVLWTGLLHSTLGIVNPYLDQRIDWWSFAASQAFFGLVAGYTVTRLGNLRQLAQVPLSVRLGIESPGLHGGEHGSEPKQ